MLSPRPAAAGTDAASTARIALLRFLCFVPLLLAASLAAGAELLGKVVGIADGDTVTVLDRDQTGHKVRLSGIDAPERRQAYGERAKQHLAALAFGKDVVVIWHKRDRYGRIIGKVLAPDCEHSACAKTLDAGLTLVSAGLAWHYKQYKNEQEANDRARYSAAEDAARRNRAGLWHDENPVAPWNYRRGSGRAQAAPHSRPM